MDIGLILTILFVVVVLVFLGTLTVRMFINQGKILTKGIDVLAAPSGTHSERRQDNVNNTISFESTGNRTKYHAVFKYEVDFQTYTAHSAPQKTLQEAEALLTIPGVKVRYLPADPKTGIVILPGSSYENMNQNS